MSAMLGTLDDVEVRGATSQSRADQEYQQKLIDQRLGVAAGLYSALRVKHAPTAAHCLRVAIGCSSWSQQLNLTSQMRDEIEVAALLHDVGKLGVPDHVLLKPCKLEGDEILAMDRARLFSRDILSSFCSSPGILLNVLFAPAWFDGRRHGFELKGDDLPLGARIISIIDAFDSMTTDSVYRKAYPRERAIGELFSCAGTQFDPTLVRDFCHLLSSDASKLGVDVARRWLRDLNPNMANAWWQFSKPTVTTIEKTVDVMFQQKLLESMHDGVIFVDCSMRIMMWNRASERLTGISAASVLETQWQPAMVNLCDEEGQPFKIEECPIAFAIVSGVQQLRRLSFKGRNGEKVAVDVHFVPVVGRDGAPHGAAVLLRDASRTITLEERVQSLHEKATRDPLTQVANRAEFDRVQTLFLETHLQSQAPCALIICDIDHFKKVNDTYGHQAGDSALIAFANLLRSACRAGDLVARYGGEEFAMLCADCDNATATARAEDIRRSLAELPQPALQGNCMTASFGVTEMQGGDSPETMLRRADRALYQAKEDGRNRVVQLGSGLLGNEPPVKSRGWFSWFTGGETEQILVRDLFTPVPLAMTAEKLRGFVADKHAQIESIDENHVVLQLDEQAVPMLRRRSDRQVPFFIDLQFEEQEVINDENRRGFTRCTVIHVSIRPRRPRDRRSQDVQERAKHLLVSLRSYLMAQEMTDAHRRAQGKSDPTKTQKAAPPTTPENQA